MEQFRNILVLLLFISVLINLHYCTRNLDEVTTITKDTKIDTLWLPQDTFKIVQEGLNTKDSIIIEIPIEVDTGAILASYYTERYYDDTINIKDLFAVRIKETIFNNKIKDREITSWSLQPIINKETTITERTIRYNRSLYGGAMVLIPSNDLEDTDFGLGLNYTTRNIQLGYGYYFFGKQHQISLKVNILNR